LRCGFRGTVRGKPPSVIMTLPIQADAPQPYDHIAIALHWLIGLALLGQIGFGFLLDDIAPRNTPARAGVINLHKSFGIVLGALILVRVAWWLTHRPPPSPASMPAWQQWAARWTHRLLYLCMLIMPVSGYVGSNVSKHGVRFFGHAWAPWGPDDRQLYALFNGAHRTTAVVFALLIGLHVAAALGHALRRDGIVQRMLPFGSSRRQPRRASP
jgi:cytochrome b561